MKPKCPRSFKEKESTTAVVRDSGVCHRLRGSPEGQPDKGFFLSSSLLLFVLFLLPFFKLFFP